MIERIATFLSVEFWNGAEVTLATFTGVLLSTSANAFPISTLFISTAISIPETSTGASSPSQTLVNLWLALLSPRARGTRADVITASVVRVAIVVSSLPGRILAHTFSLSIRLSGTFFKLRGAFIVPLAARYTLPYQDLILINTYFANFILATFWPDTITQVAYVWVAVLVGVLIRHGALAALYSIRLVFAQLVPNTICFRFTGRSTYSVQETINQTSRAPVVTYKMMVTRRSASAGIAAGGVTVCVLRVL